MIVRTDDRFRRHAYDRVGDVAVAQSAGRPGRPADDWMVAVALVSSGTAKKPKAIA